MSFSFSFLSRLLALAGLALFAGCGGGRTAPGGAPSPKTCAWLELARQVAVKIPSEFHAVERERALADAATAALELGAEAQAEAIAGEICGWRRGDLFARFAARCFVTARLPQGDRFLTLAQEAAKGEGLEDWQRSRVQVSVERARQARPAAAASDARRVSRLEPADQAALLPDLVEHRAASSNLLETLSRLEAVTNQVLDLDSAAGAVDAYRVLYQKAGALPEAEAAVYRERVFAGVKDVFVGLHPALACEKLIDFGEAAAKAGATNFVLQLCAEIEQKLPIVRADMRAPVQTRYGRFLAGCGWREDAAAQLEAVAGFLGDSAVLAEERAVAWARLAVAWAGLGQASRAAACHAEAARHLAALVNARPRAVAAVAVCVIYARAEVSEPSVMEGLRAVSEGLGDPW